MNSIRNTLLLLALAAPMTLLAEGPDDGRRGPREGRAKEAMLKRFDKDGDGKLSDEERKAAREARKERREEFHKKFDKDGDGKLSEEEREAMKAEHEAHRKAILEKYDTDKDGKLSKEEREVAMKEWQEKLLKEFDADSDGKLSDEERKKAHETLRERGEHPPFPHRRGKNRGDNENKPNRDDSDLEEV